MAPAATDPAKRSAPDTARGYRAGPRRLPDAPRTRCYPREVMNTEFSSSLLVAMPQLQDPNFRRSVVQLIEHDEQGSFGLVLNREVDLSAADLCESLELEWHGDPRQQIRWGGPGVGCDCWSRTT